MTDAGFFKGTSADQDARFADKKKKLMKSMKFSDNLSIKVDMSRIRLEAIRPWITKRITELLGFEDEVVCDYVFNQLEEQHPNPKEIQMNITGFLNGKNARIFLTELWDLLVSAMKMPGGVPNIENSQDTTVTVSENIESRPPRTVPSNRSHDSYKRSKNHYSRSPTPVNEYKSRSRRRSRSSSRSSHSAKKHNENPIPVVNSRDILAARERDMRSYSRSSSRSSRDRSHYRRSRKKVTKRKDSSEDRYSRSSNYRRRRRRSLSSDNSVKKSHSYKSYGSRRHRNTDAVHDRSVREEKEPDRRENKKLIKKKSSPKESYWKSKSPVSSSSSSDSSDDSSSSSSSSSSSDSGSSSFSASNDESAFYGPPVCVDGNNVSPNKSKTVEKEHNHNSLKNSLHELSSESSGTSDSDPDSDVEPPPISKAYGNGDGSKLSKKRKHYDDTRKCRESSRTSPESELRRRALASMVKKRN